MKSDFTDAYTEKGLHIYYIFPLRYVHTHREGKVNMDT